MQTCELSLRTILPKNVEILYESYVCPMYVETIFPQINQNIVNNPTQTQGTSNLSTKSL